MGEITVNPIHNVHKKYRDVNLVNPYLFQKPFQSTWRTSNVSTGSSTSTQIRLPLVSTGSYNFSVSWGDGTSDIITSWNQAQVTHTYASSGDYIIKISGNCVGWQFNATGDRLKLLSIEAWGKLKLGSNIFNHFSGCSNLNLSTVSDILDLSGTTSIGGLFLGCTSLTTINRIGEWDTSSISNMAGAFTNCTNFNQSLGNWNVSNVTNFTNMFSNTTLFNNGGSATINNWTINNLSSVLMNGMFNTARAFNQPIGNWNVSKVTNMSQMFFGAIIFNQSLGAWNTSLVADMSQMFQGAIVFNQNIGSWNTSSVTNFGSMFNGTTSFNNGGSNTINNWTINTGSSVLMNGMFQSATAFNQPVGNWNISNVVTLMNMFNSATAFNQNLGSWNVSKVTNFQGTFSGAIVFNNGSSNTINNWVLNNTVSATINMSQMFQNATVFNQPLNNWNTVNVTNMNAMFARTIVGTNLFNQNIGAWNVSKVIDFGSMFGNPAAISSTFISFNNGGSSDINNWSLSTVSNISMAGMFAFSSFNQPLNNWNTIRVTNMANMFQSAANFNQPLNLWNTTNVTNMRYMFINNPAFNQNIGAWNVSNVTDFSNFMLAKIPSTFSSTNLDAIYNGWSTRPVKPNMNITFGAAKYTSASTAGKAILTGSPNNWVIADGGI